MNDSGDTDKIAVLVCEIVAENLGVKRGEVLLESNLVDDLGADSLDLVEVATALEKEFDRDPPAPADDPFEVLCEHDCYNFTVANLIRWAKEEELQLDPPIAGLKHSQQQGSEVHAP